MGAELSLLVPTAQTIAVSAYIDSLQDIQYSKPLSTSRFLKTVKCLDKSGSVVVKLLIKPTNSSNSNDTSDFNLEFWVKQMDHLRKELIDLPNVLPFESVIDSQRAGFLIRPYIRYNLYDRVSIRPFLEPIEKKWIVYQLLYCFAKMHAKGVYHGDLKTENVLLTSWNWCLVSDFAIFKPVYLPEGNPSLFSFYFDTSQRHVCYVAPERFVASDDSTVEEMNKNEGGLHDAMDIFSLGCVIAELYLEGLPIFTLPQMFKFKSGEYSPSLDTIDDLNIRKMIQSMISLDPEDRLSAKDYLTRYRKSVFPDYFYTFLHPYVKKSSSCSIEKSEDIIVKQFTMSDTRIERLYNDFDKIALYLGFKKIISESSDCSNDPTNKSMIPMKLGLPGMKDHIPKSTSQVFSTIESTDCSCLIPLSLVLHSVRNTTHASFRIQACDLILAFAEQLPDEAKLDRCLPYLVYMLDDPGHAVQTTALRSMTQLLTMVDTITPINVHLFQDYILPKLESFLRRSYANLEDLTNSSNLQPRPIISRNNASHNNQDGRYVRSVFANCLPHLATVARKFYEMANLLKSQISNFEDPETENHYSINSDSLTDTNYKKLVEGFEGLIVQLLTDPDSYVRTALLNNILPLCSFFGKEKTNDVILSHLITYLNDKDSQIKLSFVSSIVPISVFVGIVSLEQYILPLLAQALNEPDEMLVIDLIKAFTELVKLGLIRKRYLWDLVKLTTKLLLHPNELIRNSILNLIIAICDNLSVADLYCMLYPLIRPYFQYEVTNFSWETLYVCVHKPITRAVYNMAKTWSLKNDPTLFWQRVDSGANRIYDSFGSAGLMFMMKKNSRSSMYRLSSQGAEENSVVDNMEIPLSQFDLQQVEKLKSVGLHDNELWKIATLRPYIYRVARIGGSRFKHHAATHSHNSAQALTSKMNVLPRSVFVNVYHETESVTRETERLSSAGLTLPNVVRKSVSQGTDQTADASIDTNGTRIPAMVAPSSADNKPPSGFLYGEMTKAAPSILTNEEIVFSGHATGTIGTVDSGVGGSRSTKSSVVSANSDLNFRDETLNSQNIKTRIVHSYVGVNPYIRKHFSTMSFPPNLSDFPEFGKELKDIGDFVNLRNATAENGNVKNATGASTSTTSGLLVGRLFEHNASVNCISASPDHRFFVTGDEFGFLKLWDTSRFETNATGNSIFSINLGSAIKSISFMEKRYCFAVATKDGSIKIFRLGVQDKSTGSKFKHATADLTLIRDYKVKEDDLHALSIQFLITNDRPLLAFSTPSSKLILLDIRYMRPVSVLQNNLSYGIPQCFAIDEKKSWAVIGTTKGVLCLWDLSFELMLKAVRFKKTLFPIKQIKIIPGNFEINNKKNAFISVIGGSGESDVTVWDVSKLQPRTVLCTSSVTSTIEIYSVKELEAEPDIINEDFMQLSMNIDWVLKNKSSTALTVTQGVDGKPYLVSSTPLGKIIKWDLIDPAQSRLVIGGLKNSNLHDTPVFSSTQINANLSFINERYTTSTSGSESTASSRKKVVNEQQELLKNHTDAINDILVLKRPFELIVSADRSGVINVYK